MTFRSRSVSTFSCAIPFGKTARNRPDVDFESDSVDTADVDRPGAPADFPGLPGLADELPDSPDAVGGLDFGCRVASPVVGNNAFRLATLPAGRAATRVAEFSRALPFGETACNRLDADLESDGVDATDVDRPAAPIDFPDLPGFADELPDSADAAGGLVFGRRAAPSVLGNDAAVRTCKGLRFRVATLPAERAAARVAEFSRALPFGESACNRLDADLESDSVDATDVDRPAAPIDFPDLPGFADALPDSADAAGGLVFGRRAAPSVLGNDAALRSCEGWRFEVATLPAERAAARVAEFSRALPFGETACNRLDADLESDRVDATDVDRPAAPIDFPDLPGFADELPDSADAAGGLVFGRRAAPSVLGNDAALRSCKGWRFEVATLPVGPAARLVSFCPGEVFRQSGLS